jgi:hypothetical protein
LPGLQIENNNLNYLFIWCRDNLIEDIKDFAASLMNLNKLETLKLFLNRNKIKQIPEFKMNNKINILKNMVL